MLVFFFIEKCGTVQVKLFTVGQIFNPCAKITVETLVQILKLDFKYWGRFSPYSAQRDIFDRCPNSALSVLRPVVVIKKQAQANPSPNQTAKPINRKC